ncbi:MAG: LLM class flavin-dependent oxidoreductase [Pseudonocardia sp.]|nr:LLM class flavin-dependent oxidoreductase [Pseudonocardia sp.]
MHPTGDLRLSVLDTSPIVAGSDARTALRNTIDLARLTDRLGYHRYWVPEHHGMRGVASSATAVVVDRVAGATERIRVGSGGVLLPNHSPLVVAEQFGTLEAFHPGRIDLGLGRALGGNPRVIERVRPERDRTSTGFAAQLGELLGYFRPADDQPVRAIPAAGNVPPVWILGSGESSARLAAAAGLPYAFAHHLRPGHATDALRAYREGFVPSESTAGPTVLLSVSVIVAETDERAEWLAGSTRLKVLSRRRGHRILLPHPEDAARHPYTDDDRALIAETSKGVLSGSPETVADLLREVVADTGADELMVTSPIHDHDDRRCSYELLSGW